MPGTDTMVTGVAGGPRVSEGEGCAVQCWPHFCDQAMKTSGGGAILGERTRGREKVVKLVGSLFLE